MIMYYYIDFILLSRDNLHEYYSVRILSVSKSTTEYSAQARSGGSWKGVRIGKNIY